MLRDGKRRTFDIEARHQAGRRRAGAARSARAPFPATSGRVKAWSEAPQVTDSRDVSLTIPARADYLVLARLALSAVCRLTRSRRRRWPT